MNELFNLGVKNTRLYSDLLYQYQDYEYKVGDEKIAIYSSQAKILGYLPSSKLKPESIYKTKDALIMYRKGKAGTLFIPFHNIWTCSENAIPLLLREKYKNKINLEALIISIQDKVYEKSTGKSDNANANWNMIRDMEIDYVDDEKVIKQYDKITRLLNKCRKFEGIINNQLKKSVVSKGEEVKINHIFNVTSGIRITENQVYEHAGNLPCITSQTTKEGITWRADENWLKSFIKNKKSVIIDSPCITWAKDGNAGRLFYRDYKFYPNDHCGVLLPKNNKINLKWFMYTYQQFIYPHVTSKKSQGMLYEEQMANIDIIFPNDPVLEKRIADEYEKLVGVRNRLKSFISELKTQSRKIAI